MTKQTKGGGEQKCEHAEAVYWNPYNAVVQCHKCGQVFVPKGKSEVATGGDDDCTCELKGGIVHTVSCALWDKTVEKVMKESTGGDWEEEFEKWGTEIKISNEPRKTKVYVVDGLKEFIASELTKARDEAYKDGARTQAEMDAKLVSEARHQTAKEIGLLAVQAGLPIEKLDSLKDWKRAVGVVQNESYNRGQLDLVTAISKIADDLTDNELMTMDYDLFAEKILEWLDKKLKSNI